MSFLGILIQLLLAAIMLSVVTCLHLRAKPPPRCLPRRPLSLRATEVCIEEYMASIEDELLRCGPVAKRYLSKPNLKPMIRTLLGFESKVVFDETIRAARKREEYKRLASFWRDTFAPVLLNGRLETAQQLSDFIAEALEQPPETGAKAFRRLGSGRYYKGNVVAMLEDVALDTVQAYREAAAPLDDKQAISLVIGESQRSGLDTTKIEAALKCLAAFSPNKTKDPAYTSQKNGRDSEKACIDFLYENREPGSIILENVMINHKSCSGRPKYNKGIADEKSGIIWTSIGRENLCSEIDAIVLTEAADGANVSGRRVAEIWEAKYSVSPSSLYDAMTKKLPAARAVIEDDSAVLAFHGGDVSMQSPNEGGSVKTVFGIYGRELLPAPNAVSQLKAITAGNMLVGDEATVLEAADNGFVTFDTARCLDDLNILREELKKAGDFQLTIRIN